MNALIILLTCNTQLKDIETCWAKSKQELYSQQIICQYYWAEQKMNLRLKNKNTGDRKQR